MIMSVRLERFIYESGFGESPCNATCPKGCDMNEYISDVSYVPYPNRAFKDYYEDFYGYNRSYIR